MKNEKDAGDTLKARDNPEWHKKRNARRRDRYHTDPGYRDEVKERSRKHYSEKRQIEPFDPRSRLGEIENFGKMRDVIYPNGVKTHVWCMTKAEVSEFLGKTRKMFYTWVSDGRFPDAVITGFDLKTRDWYAHAETVEVPQKVGVYHAQEVIAAVEALGEHLSRVLYYRRDHEEERERLYDAVWAAREALGIKREHVETEA